MNSAAVRRRSRQQLVLIALAFSVPVLVALAMNTPWLRFQPSSTRNLGTLIQPVVALSDLGLAEAGAELGQGTGRWTVLWLPPAAGSCATELDLLRRVRLAEGRELDRVRIALAAECAEVAGERELKLGAEVTATLRQRTGDAGRGALLLVDPYGNAMMRYPAAFDANHVKKDLARLLRYSQAGKA